MPKHPDFEQIYQNFVNQYGEEQGENYYYAWLNKNELNDTKPYNVEEQYFMRESLRESFHWVKPQTVEELNRADPDAKYYKLRALTANMSMNKNDYRDHEKMMRAARSLSWRPLNMNHDHTQWLPFPDARVHFATFEDGAVESIIRIPNYLDDIQYKLDTGKIIHPSIEGFPLEGYGKATAEGFEPEFYTFTALALLEKGVQLPGDPLTTINPLTESVQTWMTPISESMGHSLVESLKRRKKMKEQEQTTVEPTEWTDEERAKRHYELTDEQWSLLTPEERQDLIAKLPRKAEETPPATAGVVEQEQSEKPPKDWWDACMAKNNDEEICGHIFFHTLGGDRSKADPSMFESWTPEDTAKIREQLEEPLEVTAPEEQSVEVTEVPPEIPVCDPGTHWDPEQMQCVPDEIPTGETAGADATTPGPEQTMPLVTEARKKITKILKQLAEQEWETMTEEEIKAKMLDLQKQIDQLNTQFETPDDEQNQQLRVEIDALYAKKKGLEDLLAQRQALMTEQTEPEKDEYGCIIGKEEWDGETCVAIEPETAEKLKEQEAELEVQGEEITTEPSHVPPAECEPGTHRNLATGLCVPDEPTSPEDALPITVPEEETTLEKYLKENIKLKRIQAQDITEKRELKHDIMVKDREVSSLKRKLAEVNGHVAELEKEQLHNLDIISQRDETIQELEDKRGRSSGRLSSLSRRNTKLEKDMRDCRHNHEKLTSKFSDLRENYTANLNELNKTSTRLLEVEKKNKQLAENCMELQKEIAQLTEEQAKVTRENANLTERLAEQAKKTFSLEKSNINMNRELKDLREKLKKARKFGKIIVKV